MDKEHKKTLWLMVGIIAVFGLLFLMVSGKLDRFMGSLLPGFSTIKEEEKESLKKPEEVNLEDGVDYKARVVTSMGDFVIDLYELDTPYTVTNFVYLAESNFYDGLTFHRIIRDLLIQGGDPNGDGSGGPGYVFDDEIRSKPFVKGSVAMASTKSNNNGSQFFVMLANSKDEFNRKYTMFGEIESGINVVEAIASTSVKDNGSGEISKPVGDIVIEDIEIIKESF